jgi:SAM-dependent methyltransferase
MLELPCLAVGANHRYPIRSWLFHKLCTEPEPQDLPPDHAEAYMQAAVEQDERFFSRLPELKLQGRSALDYGCGLGNTCVALAQRGARRVLGVDIQSVDEARAHVAKAYPELADRIEFRQVASAEEIADERFDLVLSKNTFEHVADPARYVADMAGLLAPGGGLVIGFSPFWKSPYGGHLDFMTKLPWSHLLFPESVILRERKRYRPDEDPSCFEEVRGGMNRMRPATFESIMRDAGLEPTYYEINRNERPIARALNAFSRLPGIGEYFTFSVHSIWHVRPPATP